MNQLLIACAQALYDRDFKNNGTWVGGKIPQCIFDYYKELVPSGSQVQMIRFVESSVKDQIFKMWMEPKVNIRCEYKDHQIQGSTSLNVTRVEREDDGSLTVVTDYWPR